MRAEVKKSKKTKLLVILGPTSSGKSELAVKIAKKLSSKGGPAYGWKGAEIISADSRQIYKGLNIATGKITKAEMKGIPHHLLDVVSAKKQYTASDYVKDATKVLRYIIIKGKLPIICGGSGFYISALLGEIKLANVPPNLTLRSQLLGHPMSKLYEMLIKLDPKRAETVDRNNPVRLIRAIEIAKGQPTTHNQQLKDKFDILKIGLTLPKNELQKRIKSRLLARLKKGMISEARKLHQNGLSYKRMNELGLEYRALALYLQSKISKQELMERIEKENWHYAKRQMTWFKRDKEIRWFESADMKSILASLKKFK